MSPTSDATTNPYYRIHHTELLITRLLIVIRFLPVCGVCLEVRVYISAVMFADGLLLPPRYVADMGSYRIPQGPGKIFSPKTNAVNQQNNPYLVRKHFIFIFIFL